ncbi:MAG: 4Fe-4S binding protein [bacterium]|nr:MAG: 4Fe-4S binding protein [bacterium]
MCEFCTEHGEGRAWYLNAQNYATELLNEMHRQKFIAQFYEDVIGKGQKQLSMLERVFQGKIFIPRNLREKRMERSKKSHFGQIIPIGEIPKILRMARSIVRVSCGCRWAAEKKESRTCYGLSAGPPDWYEGMDLEFFGSPDVSRFEQLTREEAYHAMVEDDREGMVHSLWTFHTPFIGAICNCDGRYCLAMRSTVGQKIPSMFRAEFIAEVDDKNCPGCKACVARCQFRAIDYHGKKNPVTIDAKKCFGCGVCQAACPQEAISLVDRSRHPVGQYYWV